MGDSRLVERDTIIGEARMTPTLIGHNNSPSESIAAESYRKLQALVEREHRGRHDTWTSALDKTARGIGVAPSYAHRIWFRWEHMRDVSGAAYRAISQAYDAACERVEAAADHQRELRKEIENGDPPHQGDDVLCH